MADNTQVNFQNPYAMFDPTQWSNQFSLYNNKALPWPSSYVGWPTDAMGNPIKPPQGTTINSSPVAPPAAPAPQQPAFNPAAAQAASQMMMGAGMNYNADLSGGRGQNQADAAYTDQMTQANAWRSLAGMPSAQPQAAAQPQPAAQGGGGQNLDYNSVLSLLANPGRVTTPGATVPAASGVQPGPGVLQQFMANWKPAQSGPGSGFQQGFANALKGMGY